MNTKELLVSVRIIESTVLQCIKSEIETCDHILVEEIKKIQQSADDTFIQEMIFGIYYNWKIYSGQHKGIGIPDRYSELENIIVNCGRIKSYLVKHFPDTNS